MTMLMWSLFGVGCVMILRVWALASNLTDCRQKRSEESVNSSFDTVAATWVDVALPLLFFIAAVLVKVLCA